MFSGYCATTGKETLMGLRRAMAWHNTDDGVEFDYVCVCGAMARYQGRLGTGRHQSPALSHEAA